MEYIDIIIKIVAFFAAIVAIWKGLVFFVHLSDDLKEIKEHTKENYLSGLRLTVMSPYMPIGERIIAGDDYIKAGGNGEVKHYIEAELHANEVIKKQEDKNKNEKG